MPLNPSGFVKTLQEVAPSPHYALAVSGGCDSMALVALAAAAQEAQTKFSVLSVNHGLRAEAAAEIKQVETICASLHLPHYTLTADYPLPKTGLQEAARHLRYGLMAAWCKQNGAGALVVAHHLEDQAETILMRLAHYSGIAGLGGMTARQVLHTAQGDIILVRPFLQHSRTALEEIVKTAKLKWSDDPTNNDTQYERVRWRKLLPQLEMAGLTPDILTALAAQCREASDEINRTATQWLEAHATYNAYGFFEIDRPAFTQITPPLQKRIIQALVQWLGVRDYPPASAQIENLITALDEKPYGAMTFGGCLLRWQSRHLWIGCEVAHINTNTDRRFSIKGEGLRLAPLGEKGVQILREQGATLPEIPAAYLQALPALFDDREALVACPPLEDEATLLKQLKFSDILTKNYV